MKNWKWVGKLVEWGKSLKESPIITVIYIGYCVMNFMENLKKKKPYRIQNELNFG